MSIAPRVQELRVDTLSIVPDAQAKKALGIGDVGFDFLCLGVAASIQQRFPGDAVNVVAKDGMQLPGGAFYRDSKRRRGAAGSMRTAEFLS